MGAGLPHYKRLSVMLARRSGAWLKNTLFVAAAKRQFNSFYTTKKRVAHYCAVLNHATVTGSQKFGIFVYNEEPL